MFIRALARAANIRAEGDGQNTLAAHHILSVLPVRPPSTLACPIAAAALSKWPLHASK